MQSHVRTVLALFEGKRRYMVPLFQRQYVWQLEKQWKPLWEDIERKVADRLRWEELGGGKGLHANSMLLPTPGEHFLGAIVLDQHPTSGDQVQAHLVIDGQQRLATAQVVLAALRDIAEKNGVEKYSSELASYLTNSGIMADPTMEKYKVWPSRYDQLPFKAIIDGAAAEAPGATPRLIQAYRFFHQKLADLVSREVVSDRVAKQPGIHERVAAVFEIFRKDLKIVTIELEGQDDPQVIFETLNARGEPLLPSDLLRNYLFWRASRNNESLEALYDTYWQHFDTDFWKKEEKQGRWRRPRVDLFFYNLLQVKTGREVNVARLYWEYREWSQSTARYQTAGEELAEIDRYSPHVQTLLSPANDTPIGRFAQVLQTFDVKTIFPLVLKLLADGRLEPPKLESILVDLESYLVRRQICGLTAANYNRVFVNWVEKMNKDGSSLSPQGLRSMMLDEKADSSVWPDDARLLQSWMDDALYPRLNSNGRMECILRRLELDLRTKMHEDVTINSKLTVEHVLPQTWIEHWRLSGGQKGSTREERVQAPSPESDRRDRMLQTIGNLTLLTMPANLDNSHLPFDKKVDKMYKNSTLLLNRYFKERADEGKGWDESAIEERGRALFKRAAKIWPYPSRDTDA